MIGAVQRILRAYAFFLILFLIFSDGTSVAAQTIEQALAAAYQNNPTLQAKRVQLRATDEAVPQAEAGWRPTIMANGEIGRTRVEGNLFAQSQGTQYRTPSSVGVTVSQPLFRGGRTIYGTREAENRVQAERARLRVVEAEVLLDAATAFLDVERDQAVVELNINNEQILRRQMEAANDRFAVGEITRTDVAQAEARLAGARADRIRAEGNLAASRAVYMRVIGAPPGKLVEPVPLGNLPKSQDEAIRYASVQFPGVVAAEFDEKSAQQSVNLVEGELLPTVSLNSEFNKSKEQFSTVDDTERATVSARLTIPIYQAGSVYSRLREAREVASQRRTQVEEARRTATENATRAWSDLQATRASIISRQAQIEASAIALEGVHQEALVGSRTVLDVLDAEQELLDAKVSLARSRRDAFVADFRLRSAMGTLTAQALNLPVKIYDVNQHYDAVRGQWIGFGGGSD
ncbi:MAG: TolC family outer membrane protein [Pseudomonadota bacterium]